MKNNGDSMEHICIVTTKYPCAVEPTALTFVQQLAWTFADLGKRVTVICPLPTNLNREYKELPYESEECTYLGSKVKLYFPKYFGLGQKKILFWNTAGITTANFTRAVNKVIMNMGDKPDALYGHFITPAGLTACKLSKVYNIPAFIAYGESVTWSIENIGFKKVKKAISNVRGIISVSTKNKNDLINCGVVEEEKINVFPNGFMPSRFLPKDKVEAREHFGFSKDAFIVAFVGHYIKRKGITVLKEAVDKLDDTFLICAGKGDLSPEGKNVLYTGEVNPDELAYFYSAADVFVLPTLNEGCCNAIIEAMACGLPIISSDLPFNDDILDDTNSLRIDPTDVDAIIHAISKLKNDKDLNKKLSKGSLEKAKSLTLERRADNILRFMENGK